MGERIKAIVSKYLGDNGEVLKKSQIISETILPERVATVIKLGLDADGFLARVVVKPGKGNSFSWGALGEVEVDDLEMLTDERGGTSLFITVNNPASGLRLGVWGVEFIT